MYHNYNISPGARMGNSGIGIRLNRFQELGLDSHLSVRLDTHTHTHIRFAIYSLLPSARESGTVLRTLTNLHIIISIQNMSATGRTRAFGRLIRLCSQFIPAHTHTHTDTHTHNKNVRKHIPVQMHASVAAGIVHNEERKTQRERERERKRERDAFVDNEYGIRPHDPKRGGSFPVRKENAWYVYVYTYIHKHTYTCAHSH